MFLLCLNFGWQRIQVRVLVVQQRILIHRGVSFFFFKTDPKSHQEDGTL